MILIDILYGLFYGTTNPKKLNRGGVVCVGGERFPLSIPFLRVCLLAPNNGYRGKTPVHGIIDPVNEPVLDNFRHRKLVNHFGYMIGLLMLSRRNESDKYMLVVFACFVIFQSERVFGCFGWTTDISSGSISSCLRRDGRDFGGVGVGVACATLFRLCDGTDGILDAWGLGLGRLTGQALDACHPVAPQTVP
jgi:hypothetical protein